MRATNASSFRASSPLRGLPAADDVSQGIAAPRRSQSGLGGCVRTPPECPRPLRWRRSRCRHPRGALTPAFQSRCCHRFHPARTPTPWWLPSVLRTDSADAFASPPSRMPPLDTEPPAPDRSPNPETSHRLETNTNATVRIRGAPRRVISPAHSIRSPAGPADVAADQTNPSPTLLRDTEPLGPVRPHRGKPRIGGG